VNLIFDGFEDALVKGDRIEIRGFGSFVMRNKDTTPAGIPRQGKRSG